MVVLYCCHDHQLVDRKNHGQICKAIVQSQRHLNDKETELCSASPMLFQAYLGRFWGRSETQSYLRTRHALAKALLQIKTYDAVKAAHDHLMDILHLDRGDSMEVRDLVPALKLRLGRDQECYAFCVWYAMSRKGGDFWWYNMDVSVFTNVNAKVLNFFDQRTIMSGASLRHKISVVLLKIRSYLALQSLRNASLLVEKVPQEIIIAIREQVVCESIFGGADEIDLYDVGSQTAAIRILQAHIKELYQVSVLSALVASFPDHCESLIECIRIHVM